MVSRILGFGLGVLFLLLGGYLLFGAVAPQYEFELLGFSIGNMIMLGLSSVIGSYSYLLPTCFILFGVFALQSAIRDTWPFYG
jgi:hypothetical protein